MSRLAVIGYPIRHTLSPALQQAALDAFGIDARYTSAEVTPDELAEFVSDIRDGGWLGINVTVPHKEAILPFLDDVSPEAESIGAVNTVVVRRGRLQGHNTDAAGFARSLSEDAGFDPRGQRVALLGAGGAARAVLWSLVQGGARSVLIVNRGLERATRLVATARRWSSATALVEVSWQHESLAAALEGCALVVNATPIGLHDGETPLPADQLPAEALVVDLIYNPRPSLLLREAARRGLRTLDGLPMLIYQGAAAFELFTNRPAPVETMRTAAEAALEV